MKRIESLTFLRFVAAFIVVVFHFGRDTTLANYTKPFITAGPQMVSFFFVLSGFVMTVAYYDKDSETLRDYYVTRIARIVPIYMLALALSIFLYYGTKYDNLTALLLDLTFLQAWFPPYPTSLNGPAWSISVEAFFYFTFPFILLAIKKSNISWKKLAILSILFYFFTQAILSDLLSMEFYYSGHPLASHDLIYFFPLSHFCSFLLGVSGGVIYAKHPEWFNRTGFLPFITLVIALSVNYAALQYPNILDSMVSFPLAYGSSFHSLLFSFLVLSLAYSKSIITKIMSLPFLILLGDASYSLYILQQPIYSIYKHFANYIFSQTGISEDGRFYIFAVLLIIISIISLYIIEKPARRIILKLNQNIFRSGDSQ